MDKKLSREHKRNGELNDLKKQLEASLKAKQKEIRLYVPTRSLSVCVTNRGVLSQALGCSFFGCAFVCDFDVT
jgi:hypothetical protein